MKNHNEYVGGIPDVWYSGTRADLWVEYKYLPIAVPRTRVIPDLSVKQLHWIRCRQREGRNVWTIVGYKPGGVIFTDPADMEHGMEPEEFVARTLGREELAQQIEEFCLEKEPPITRG